MGKIRQAKDELEGQYLIDISEKAPKSNGKVTFLNS